jgi:cytochrome c peroxidase
MIHVRAAKTRRVPFSTVAAAIAALGILAGVAQARSMPVEPADAVQSHYTADARNFLARATAFRRLIDSLPTTSTGDAALRREVARLRADYKRLEFLVDYAQPGSATRLNPPPFDRADPIAPDAMEVLPPEGLQILQEVAFGKEPLARDRSRLSWLSHRLEDAARELAASVARPTLDDRMLFEAAQAQVIRVMTLGIVGFDAPAKEYALPESRLSLEALRPALAGYAPALRGRDAALAARLDRALATAIAALPAKPSAAAFDAFDRLAFIRRAGDPLYAALIDAQRALGIATFNDLAPLRRPVSAAARGLFARDFLDPHYYAFTPGERRDTAAAALGRALFFDALLSVDTRRSCASCHDPRRAFTDGLPKSPALGGGSLPRNAPSLPYAAYQNAQFWDMREETLENQVMHVVAGAGEFHNDFLVILRRLQAQPEYPGRFRTVFGGEEPLQVKTITKALAMYVRSLGRWDSPFDRYARGETEFLDPAAKRGFNLFMGKAACATCHFAPAFNGTVPPRYVETESEVLGVPERFPADTLRLDDDLGRGLLRVNPVHRRAFKTPSVRDAALTAPYMHNGGMKTLEDVMRFYNAGGGKGLGLDVPHQTLPADSLGLTRREMDDVVAFLKSLTDAGY